MSLEKTLSGYEKITATELAGIKALKASRRSL
jgi:hypothetical protein